MIAFWKSEFSRKHLDKNWEWQRGGFHHRLRDAREYQKKWQYVRENPLRKGLVTKPEDWPYSGVINELRF